jgi:hypothetical protein
MSVKDIAPILGKELYVNNSLLVIEDMHVEQTRPCSTLEGMLIHTHNKELTTDKLKDRVEACGVPCVVERVGEELTIRTGHKGLAENTRKAFKVRVHVTKPAHGIVLQSFPLSGGGRYGGGMLVPSDAPSLAVPVGDMLSVRDVAKQLGIDASQACRILRDKLRMAPFESMYQRCINADTMRRIGDAHRDCRKRVEYPHTGKRWTEEQLAVVWDWIQGRCTWKDVSATTGKTMAACKTMRVRMLNQTGGF